jgi:hypothetical protein
MAPNPVYMLVLMDSASDNYNYGVLQEKAAHMRGYSSLEAAKAALVAQAAKFEEFMPTAYGKAFPYDTVTFEQQLEKERFAPWGWGIATVEDEVQRICVGLIAITVE